MAREGNRDRERDGGAALKCPVEEGGPEGMSPSLVTGDGGSEASEHWLILGV